jgi:hypothetical protein
LFNKQQCGEDTIVLRKKLKRLLGFMWYAINMK